MDKPDIATLLRNTPKLASLPTVYNKLNEAVDSPTSSSQDIADIIMEDSALAARLLKLSNSAFFGFPSRIDTISQAVTVIGMRELRDLVLATSVVSMFKDIPTNLVSPESFIEHSIATGVAARVMATHRRESNVERFFVAGLLHDIGRLVLFM
ncbi:MAG: HDOD domain-containing protein, partial [Gammaproteobacteria bacterium]